MVISRNYTGGQEVEKPNQGYKHRNKGIPWIVCVKEQKGNENEKQAFSMLVA